MGLRVGILVTRDATRFDAFTRTMRADCYAASSIAGLLVCQLINDGQADDILAAVAQETSSRMTLAWLPMPELRSERVIPGRLAIV